MATTGLAITFQTQWQRWAQDKMAEYPPDFSRIFHLDKTDRRFNDVALLTGPSMPQQRYPGAPIESSSIKPNFPVRYTVADFGLSDQVPVEDVDDDLWGVYARLITGHASWMASRYVALMESLTGSWFSNICYSTSPQNMFGDGVALFSQSHPQSATNQATLVSNLMSPGDITPGSVQSAINAIGYQQDSAGVVFIRNKIDKIVCNESQQFYAMQTLKGYMGAQPFSADRTPNVIDEANGGRPELIVWPYLQGSGPSGTETNNSWFVVGKTHYLHFYMRQPVKVESDYAPNIRSYSINTSSRFTFGADDFRGTAGNRGY